jgi:HK97 family phage prohead protease
VELAQRKILSLHQWKELAAKDEAPKDCLVLVSADVEETKQIDEDGNVYRFVISSQNPDRDKDVIHVNGWRFENYNKNPVVLFGHNYRALPVAVGSPPTVEGEKVLSNADFAASRVDAFAETVRQYVKAKVLRASSVGFDPLKWMFNEERRGYDFVEQELLEWSIVPVPAHPEALQLAKSLNLDLDPIKQWAIRALDEWSEEKGVYVPRSLLEKAAKVGDTDRVFVIFDKSQLDEMLAGTAKGEKEDKAEPQPEIPALHSHSLTHGVDDRTKTESFTGAAEDCPVCKRLAKSEDAGLAKLQADQVVNNEEGAALTLTLLDDDNEDAGEPLFDVDPEAIRQGIREALAPLIMQQTGRVI